MQNAHWHGFFFRQSGRTQNKDVRKKGKALIIGKGQGQPRSSKKEHNTNRDLLTRKTIQDGVVGWLERR
jgi:hypothetical protein